MKLTRTCSMLALLALGCDGGNGTADAGGTDAGPTDAGCRVPRSLPEGTPPDTVNCPADAPFADEQEGICCWRHSNADQLDTPEMRLTYLIIEAPVGSSLASGPLTSVLNRAMQDETFNWLFRVDGAGADGPVTITTGFGRRQGDGTYAFSTGAAGGDPAEWCPVEIDATLTGDTVRSEPLDGAITVPIFDEDGTTLQVELTLRQVAIAESTWGEDRSCVGWKANRPLTYHPAGIIEAFIELEGSRDAVINVPPVETTVCAAIAGSLNEADYCDRDQSEWSKPPDSLCDDTGCRANAPCMSDVCDPATTCNAWRLVAHFAAAGVDITNGLCGG